MWVVPALCFMPVIYGSLIAWLGDSDDPTRISAMSLPVPAWAAGRGRPGLARAVIGETP